MKRPTTPANNGAGTQLQPSHIHQLMFFDQLQINLFQRSLADDIVQNAKLRGTSTEARGVAAWACDATLTLAFSPSRVRMRSPVEVSDNEEEEGCENLSAEANGRDELRLLSKCCTSSVPVNK